MSTITIASIEVKEKRSVAITTEKRRLGFWQDQAAKLNLQIGGTYEVETTATEINGKTLVNIVKAKQIAGTPAPSSEPFVSGTYRQPGSVSAPPAGTAFRTPEQMFVSEVLTAYITNGRCEPQKLMETINFIRTAWDRTFGGHSVHQHLEAAE